MLSGTDVGKLVYHVKYIGILMEITDSYSMPWPITFVFFRLMVKLESSHASQKLSMSFCSCSSAWNTKATWSANSMSMMRASQTLVFALSRDILNSFPSDLVQRYTSKMMFEHNSKEESTQPCLTPLQMSKAYSYVPSTWAIPFMSGWNDWINWGVWVGV